MDIDLVDLCSLLECLGGVVGGGGSGSGCVGIHDLSASGVSDGSVTTADAEGLYHCMKGPGGSVGGGGTLATGAGSCNPNGYVPARTGDFGLHGRMLDVLADGKVLMHWRARVYDPEHGRFLQRDPSGYTDGANLYEAFGGNPLLKRDPSGLDDTFRSEGGVVYRSDSLLWDYGRDIGGGLVVINHPQWRWAFVVSVEDALRLFDTTAVETDFSEPLQIMQRATYLAVGSPHRSKFLIFDKNNAGLGWQDHQTSLDPVADSDLMAAANIGRASELHNVKFVAATSFTFTTGLFTLAAGAGAQIAEGVLTVAEGVGKRNIRLVAMGVAGVTTVAIVSKLGSGLRVVEEGATTGAIAMREAQQLERSIIDAARAGSSSALGKLGELRAAQTLLKRGEMIIPTQVRVGAASQGLDFATALISVKRLGKGGGVQVYLNEVKNTPGLVSLSDFTALGGRNAGQFERNIARAQAQVEKLYGLDKTVKSTILQQLEDAPIRLIGPPGFRVTDHTLESLRSITGRDIQVVIDPTLRAY